MLIGMRKAARLLIVLATPFDVLVNWLGFLALRPIVERARAPGSANPNAPDAFGAAASILAVPSAPEATSAQTIELTLSADEIPKPGRPPTGSRPPPHAN